MRGLMQDRPLDVSMFLRRAEQLFAHKRVVTATVAGETTATWRDVVVRARRLAAALDLLDVPRHARVGTFGWNSQRHLELYLAVPVSGRVHDVVFVDRSLLPTVWPLLDASAGVRRRMDLLGRAGERDHDAPGCRGGGGHRRSRRSVG